MHMHFLWLKGNFKTLFLTEVSMSCTFAFNLCASHAEILVWCIGSGKAQRPKSATQRAVEAKVFSLAVEEEEAEEDLGGGWADGNQLDNYLDYEDENFDVSSLALFWAVIVTSDLQTTITVSPFLSSSL